MRKQGKSATPERVSQSEFLHESNDGHNGISACVQDIWKLRKTNWN